MSSAALQLAGRSRIARVFRIARVGSATWPALAALLVPEALLLAGALIGFAFSLDRAVATERLVGLALASALSLLAAVGLRRVERPAAVLVATALVALLGGVWVIAASPPDLFRGVVGAPLRLIFAPLLGSVHLGESVDVDNTRFIVGYNGLADLCLVVIFACGGLLLSGCRRALRVVLLAMAAIALVVLVGAGSRGGLTGLAVGVCLIAAYAWPRRHLLLAVLLAPVGVAIAALGVLDKGLEFSSTAGRLAYWSDLARLLIEYPLTGVGLGVDTANRVALSYEINPDPDRIVYAHNTFVESYLEQGPLGALGMLLIAIAAVAIAVLARRHGVAPGRRALLIAGLGLLGGLEAHGLTDQVVTTNVGTAMLLLGLAASVAALAPAGQAALGRWSGWTGVAVLGMVVLVSLGVVVVPAGRAQALLNLGGLRLNQALALDAQALDRAGLLAQADGLLRAALEHDGGHPAVLRELARAELAGYDDEEALRALKLAAASPRLDAFDVLQIAHVYRDLGATDVAYTWAARAYAERGRAPEDAVMQTYAQATLDDERAKVLAAQAEAAMRARTFGQALALFEQARTFASDNAYLVDRVGAAQRAVQRYGG